MAWLVTVVAGARLVTLLRNMVFTSTSKGLASVLPDSSGSQTSFGKCVLASQDILEQDVQCYRNSCIRGILVADAASTVSVFQIDL